MEHQHTQYTVASKAGTVLKVRELLGEKGAIYGVPALPADVQRVEG